MLPLDILNNLHYPYCGDHPADNPDVFNHYVNDAIRFYYPAKIFLKNSITSNQFPFWNPLIFGGYAFYADSVAAVFDPFNIFLFFLEPIIAVEIGVVLQLLLAGMAMYMLLQAYKVSFWGSLLSSVGYMLNGMFVVTIYHEWMIGAFCWVPLIFLMVLKWFDTEQPKYYFFAAIFMTLAHLGGNIQVSSYIIFLFWGYIVYQKYIAKTIFSTVRFVQGIFLPFISLLLGAFLLLPTLQSFFLDASGRTSGWRDPHNFVHIVFAAPILLLNLFGNALIGSVRAFELIKLWGPGMDEFNVFCGFAVAFFAVWSFWKDKHNQKTIRFYFAMALTVFLLPLLTPLYKMSYYRILILFIFSFCVSAGFGFDAFLSDGESGDKKKYIKIFTSAILIVLGGVLIAQVVIGLNYGYFLAVCKNYVLGISSNNKFFGSHQGFYIRRTENFLHYYSFGNPVIIVSSIVIIGILGVLWLLIKKIIPQKWGKILIFLLLSTEMIVNARSFIVMSDPKKFPMYRDLAVVDELRKDKDIYRVFVCDVIKDLPLFYPNGLMPYGLETVQGADSYNPHSIKFFSLKFADLINGKYIISRQYLGKDNNLELIFDNVVRLYRNNKVMPRAFCVYNYFVAEGAENQFKKINEGGFDYRKSVVVSQMLPFSAGEPAEYNLFSKVEIKKYKQNDIEIEVDTKKDCLLVVSNTFFPGWQMKIDNTRGEIQRVNYAMQGMYVPKGRHTVKLVFAPNIFYISVAISIITLGLLFIACFLSRGGMYA